VKDFVNYDISVLALFLSSIGDVWVTSQLHWSVGCSSNIGV